MDILREFLETSTIHGLTYISSAGVSFVELFLFLAVQNSSIGDLVTHSLTDSLTD